MSRHRARAGFGRRIPAQSATNSKRHWDALNLALTNQLSEQVLKRSDHSRVRCTAAYESVETSCDGSDGWTMPGGAQNKPRPRGWCNIPATFGAHYRCTSTRLHH